MLALCLTLAMLPTAAFAAEPASQTADFTGAAEGGAEAALALLNAAKWSNAEDSTWDGDTKTLTLKGVNFTTTATTALKLPDGATIVLADGTHNTIQGGDANAAVDGTYHNDIYIYGIYAAGALTIKGGDAGTGTLSVTSGKHTNTGDAWTYSVALYAKGMVMVEGGKVALTGGEVTNGDCAFSIGLELPEGSGLSVTGGELIAKGGRSYDTGDGETHSSFSLGVYAYESSVSVSGSGKLTGDAADKHGGLSKGIYISGGNLTVSGSAEVFAYVRTGIEVSDGNLIQTGGKIEAGTVAGGYDGLSVGKNILNTGAIGNITVSGGTLDVAYGRINFSAYNATEQQGNFTVSGEGTTVYAKSVDGVRALEITDAVMRSGSIVSKQLTLNSGSLTVKEGVKEYNGKLYADPALWLDNLTVTDGTLDVSWYWGNHTPIVFPVEEGASFSTPLVRMWGDNFTAAFNGGTARFDTGCAGNIVLKLGQLSLGENIVETGAANTDTDAHTQAESGTPVVFSAIQRTNVSISDIAAQNKVYDGTDTAELTGGTLNGVAEGDNVQLDMTGVTAKFADKAVGTNKAVTVTGSFRLTGEDAYKYTLTQPTSAELGLTASITPCDQFTDATDQAQTIYVGEDSFEAPRFTGIGGETVEGDLTYHLVDEKTEADIPAMLRGLKAGEGLYIPYAFTASGNYSGQKTGTITVTAQERPASSVTPVAPTYPVTAPDSAENGSISASRKNASKGTVVTVTVQPEAGYVLETLTVTDKNGNVLELTDKGNGQFTFIMPGSKVEIAATFMEDNSVLNFFYDVPNEAYYFEAVKWAVAQEITDGVGGNLFAPDQPCTRAQIVTFLWRAAGCPEPKRAGSFSDVSEGSYYAKAVAWAAANGITGGTGEGRFSPDAACTRGEIVTLLYRYLQSKGEGFTGNWMFLLPFTDVPEWCYEAVAWCYMKNITEGTSATTFSPDDPCTRGQIVTLLYRCMK